MNKAYKLKKSFLIAIILLISLTLSAATDKQDKGSILVQPTSGLITTENGGKGTFTVALSQIPLSAVKIGLTCKDLSEGSVSPSSVTFNGLNWNSPQTVTVTGRDDSVADGDVTYQVFIEKAISSDPNYDGVKGPNVSLINWDNEGGPVANPDTATTVEDQAVITNVLANDVLNLLANTITVTTPPAHGTTTVNADNRITYTPMAGYTGPDAYVYQVCDAQSRCSTASVTITINSLNKAPQAGDDAYNLDQDKTLQVPAPGVLSNDSDSNQDTLSAILIPDTGPTNGTLVLEITGAFTYTPNVGFIGEDVFNYQATDGKEISNIALVTIQVKDTTAPILNWVTPLTNTQVYEVEKDGLVELSVNVNDNQGVASVLFNRWDPILQKYFEIDQVTETPFTTSLDTSQLLYGWNQVFARAFDSAGNPSERQFIWFYKPYRVFMPVMQK